MLLGREGEQQRLHAVVSAAREGRGTALALVGEPGIGKTALLEDARARAVESGVAVLQTQGVETESNIPFAALATVLRPVLDRLGRSTDAPPRSTRTRCRSSCPWCSWRCSC